MGRNFCRFALALMLGALYCPAETGEEEDALKQPSVEVLSDGVLSIGTVRLEEKENTIVIPAELALGSGTLEYALVTEQGKVHEALFQTKVQPYHIHVAMLLLGVQEREPVQVEAPPQQITSEYLATHPKIEGDPISIHVRWTGSSGVVERPVSHLILNTSTSNAMTDGMWIYNGSMMSSGKFLAQRDGSIVALLSDPSALVNNTVEERDKDDAWRVNEQQIPPKGVPVEIRIALLKKSERAK